MRKALNDQDFESLDKMLSSGEGMEVANENKKSLLKIVVGSRIEELKFLKNEEIKNTLLNFLKTLFSEDLDLIIAYIKERESIVGQSVGLITKLMITKVINFDYEVLGGHLGERGIVKSFIDYFYSSEDNNETVVEERMAIKVLKSG